MLPARSSASLTVASSRSRSSSADSGMFSNTVLTTRSRTSASSKTSPNAATSSSASGTNESIAKKPTCARVAVDAVVDRLQQRAPRREHDPLGQRTGPSLHSARRGV